MQHIKHILLSAAALFSGAIFGLLLSACGDGVFFVGDCVRVLDQDLKVVSYDGTYYALEGEACLIAHFCSVIRFTVPAQDLKDCMYSGACRCEN